MRRLIMMLLAVLAPLSAQAQKDSTKFTSYTYFWIESQLATDRQEVGVKKPTIYQTVSTVSIGHQASGLKGFTASVAHANTLGSPSWNEIAVGWSLATNNGLAVSAGPAIEQLGDVYNTRARLNVYYDNEKGKHFFYGQYDIGQGATWYWVDATLFLKKMLGVGMLAQMPDLGVGPKAELRMGDHFSVWAAGLKHPTDNTLYGVVGVRLRYDR